MDTIKIGRFMAACRKEKGMTQAQLAEKLGVTAKTISRWENGNYMPDLSLLQPISEQLGISLNELLNGERMQTEKLQTDELMEKTEHSLIRTLQYAAMQIKQGKRKLLMIVSVLIGCFVLVLCVIHQFLFLEIPYHEGNVSQWEMLFPNHSAYEMAIGETGAPVFKDTNAALSKVKIDCSDAIKAIKQTYELPELSRYNYQKYRYYAGLSKLLFDNNEQVMEQRRLLIDFLDILGNSYAWEELRRVDEEGNDDSAEGHLGGEEHEEETTIKVIDTSNADYEVIAYEKEIDMTADGVLDRIIFVINVTEEYKDLSDIYEILSMPFVGRVKLYDGVSEEVIWESRNISSDRIGNHQISLITKDGANYLMAGQTHEQMGDGNYYYRVLSFEGFKPDLNKEEVDGEEVNGGSQNTSNWLVDELQIVDTYRVSFVLEDACLRLFPNMLLRGEAVPDYREHIEKWISDAELIVATDVMMEHPNNIMFSTSEEKVGADTYYNLVWERLSNQTAAFEFVCPEISFPKEEWVQNLICIPVEKGVAVAKYYDALSGGYCVLKAGACTEEELLENIEYANYSFPGKVLERHLTLENSAGESIEISQCEIPFENAEYKKEVQTYWVNNGKTYVIFAYLAYDADASSIMKMAEYMASRLN